jgi:eukaryotic-like serine/threonine-protein kinase
MNPEAVHTIFNNALELHDPAARARYLQEACAGDAALYGRVEELLRAHDEAGGFFSQPSKAPPLSQSPGTIALPVTEKAGDKIGHYKLLQQIGEGGCGVVYMAEQEEPVRRRVALKVLKLGMDTKQVIARFEAERQALALMDHPNIAKVFDAGATETGRPYFVMELVRGSKITEFCDANNLSTEDRLNLLMQVCHAIQHAHQKGIIHRDIKPSNILVTINDGVPVPKVIDFGIAKATAGRLTDNTLFTAFEQFIGTPAYMSPEQAVLTSLDIDTRSDIYSLGVLLYELLTGGPPFDQEELLAAGLDEMRRTIREKEPPRPSNRLSTLAADALRTTALHRHTEPPKLIHSVRGDLDWIAMKCLEKDRARRYETANALAADIDRHLDCEPVVARPPSRLYEFQKSVRRHKFGFAAAGAVIVALSIGLGVSLWQFGQKNRAYRRTAAAEQEQSRLRQIAGSKEKKSEQVAQFLKEMLEGIDPTVAMGRDTTLLREILDRTAERLGADLKDQPALEAELRHTIAEVYLALGQQEKGEQNYRKALALRQKEFGPEHLEVAASLDGLARAVLSPVIPIQFEAMTSKDKSRIEEAEKLAREALAIRKTLLGSEHLEVAQSIARLAEVLDQKLKYVGTDSLHREALGMRQRLLGSEHPKVADSLLLLARALRQQNKLEDAERLSREALRIRVKLFPADHPSVISAKYSLARELKALSGKDWRNVVPAGINMEAEAVKARLAESETLHRETLAHYRKLLPDDHPQITTVLASFGDVLSYENKLGEAGDVYREVLIRRRKALGESHAQTKTSALTLVRVLNDNNQRDKLEALVRDEVARLGAGNTGTADWLVELGTGVQNRRPLIGAEVLFREALAIRRSLLGDVHPSVITTLDMLAKVLCDRRQLQESEKTYREALEIRRKVFGSEHPEVARSLTNLASVLRESGKLDEAEQMLREALAMQRKLLGDVSVDTATSLQYLGGILERQTKMPEAEAVYREALEVRRKLYSADNPYTATLLSDLARALLTQGKHAEAVSLYREALAMRRKTHGETHRSVEVALANLARSLEAQGKLAEAEAAWREELAVERKLSGDEHPFVANSLVSLGSALQRQGKHAEAIALFREELDRARAADGKGTASTNSGLGLLLHHFAELLWEQKAFNEARPLAEEAWALYQQHPDWEEGEQSHAYRVLHAVLTSLNDQPALESLQRNELARLRRKLRAEDPKLADAIAGVTRSLLAQKKFTEAEAPARESLAIREKAIPDDWRTFNARSLLGGSLLGQKKYAEAEPFLLAGYEGMKQREKSIPAAGKVRISEAIQRLAEFYETTGQPEKEAEWNQKLTEFDQAEAEKQVATPKSQPQRQP